MLVFVIFNLITCEATEDGVLVRYRLEAETRPQAIPYLEEGQMNEPPGYPEIRTISFLVGLPQEGKVTWIYSHGGVHYLDGVEIKPVEVMSFKGRRRGKADVYKRDNYYPDLISIEGPTRFRDLRVLRVRISPIRYNPVRKRLSITGSITIRIRFEKRGINRRRGDDLADRILKELIINYDQCRYWRLGTMRFTNPFSDGPWYKMKIDKKGIYKIGYHDLKDAGINPSVIDPRRIKVYTTAFFTLPKDKPIEFADSLVEIPIYIEGEDDGYFDASDYIIFYARSANWFDISKDSLHFNLNPYTDTNCYWLTWTGSSGQRMAFIDGSPGRNPQDRGNSFVHLEDNEYNLARAGLKWLWREILFGDSIYIKHPDCNGSIELKIVLWQSVYRFVPLKIYLNEDLIYDDTFLVNPNRDPIYINTSVSGDSSRLKIIRYGDVTDPIYLDYVDIIYLRHLRLDSTIDLLADSGMNQFKVTGCYQPPFILDITDQLDPRMVYNIQVDDGELVFSFRGDSLSHLFISNQTLTPEIKFSTPGRLRSESDGADYLIIAPEIFKNTVLPLLYYRQAHFAGFGPKVMLVSLDDVFNDFGGGRFDPTAIRNFLYYTTLCWSHIPYFVLFIGDGSYDYKNYLGRTNPPNYFPVYERDVNFNNPNANTCYDDWFAQFNEEPSMIIGRLPVQSKGQLRNIIQRVINYESGRYFGDWQNRLLLFADDEYGERGRWEWGGTWAHAANCESAVYYVPKEVEARKVYSMIYEKHAGNTRPGATDDFIANLDEGSYLVLYYGHGNHHQIAHEKIFMYEDIPRIDCGWKNFIIYFGSCGVSRFDDTKWESIGEDLLRTSGAIATIGATRGTATTPNLILGNKIAEYLWKGYTIGEAVYLGKVEAGIWNSKNYQLFTDPATKSIASKPELTLTVKPDTLIPTRTGTIISGNGYEALVYLRDSITGWHEHLLRPPNAPESLFIFQLLGSPIHRGRSVGDSLTFSLLKFDPRYDPVVRVQIFRDGKVGMIDSIPVKDSIPPSSDHDGPKVTLYYYGRELKDSTEIESPAEIEGKVEDQSGINIALDDEYTVGTDPFAVILNGETIEDLRRSFLFDLNSYARGSFRFTLRLPERKESNILKIRALDNLGNTSETTYTLFEMTLEQLKIEDLLIYPNPVQTLDRPISFSFTLNRSGYGRLQIFTVSGRLVDEIRNRPLRKGFNTIEWKPRSAIANGVYLVRLSVTGAEGEEDKITERFIIAQ